MKLSWTWTVICIVCSNNTLYKEGDNSMKIPVSLDFLHEKKILSIVVIRNSANVGFPQLIWMGGTNKLLPLQLHGEQPIITEWPIFMMYLALISAKPRRYNCKVCSYPRISWKNPKYSQYQSINSISEWSN